MTGAEGNFVTGLGIEDFELLENGEAQEIKAFAPVELPVPETATPVEKVGDILEESDYGVATNEGTESGRLYVLVMDDLHVSAQRTERVRELARSFIRDSLGPDDLVAVAFTSGRSRGFSANRSSLLASIEHFMGKMLRSSTLDRLEALAQSAAAGTPVSSNPATQLERGQAAADTLRVLRARRGCRRSDEPRSAEDSGPPTPSHPEAGVSVDEPAPVASWLLSASRGRARDRCRAHRFRHGRARNAEAQGRTPEGCRTLEQGGISHPTGRARGRPGRSSGGPIRNARLTISSPMWSLRIRRGRISTWSWRSDRTMVAS